MPSIRVLHREVPSASAARDAIYNYYLLQHNNIPERTLNESSCVFADAPLGRALFRIYAVRVRGNRNVLVSSVVYSGMLSVGLGGSGKDCNNQQIVGVPGVNGQTYQLRQGASRWSGFTAELAFGSLSRFATAGR